MLNATGPIDKLSEIVTACATVATAALMWRTGRRQVALEEPIVECVVTIPGDGLIHGEFSVRNRMDETLVVTAASVKKPRGAKISTGRYDKHGVYVAAEPVEAMIELRRHVASAGSSHSAFGTIQPSDIVRGNLYVLPPPSWRGGELRIDLRISNRSVTVRDRKVAVHRRISEDAMRKIGARPESADQK